MLANLMPRIIVLPPKMFKKHCGRGWISVQGVYSYHHYSDMHHIPIDDYVLDVLLPDLAGHDRSPSAFLVYVVLWTRLYRSGERSISISLRELAESTGLSKTAVQQAVRLLKRRRL